MPYDVGVRLFYANADKHALSYFTNFHWFSLANCKADVVDFW